MGHHSSNHQWDMRGCSLFLLTPSWAKRESICLRVRHRHRLDRRQVKEARAWVEVEDRALRPPRGEGTKRCPILYGFEILAILGVIVGKINNMLLCVKFMLICSCMSINIEVVINGNYM